MGWLEGIKENVLVLGVVSFFTDVSSEMVFPILPLFLTTILGAGAGIVGLVEGVADSISSLFDIFVGYLSDLKGKRKDFVIAGYGLSSILKVGLLFVNSWPGVLVIRGMERIGKSIRTSPRDALIAASTDGKNRGKAFGFHRGMDTLGAILGPAIAYVVFAMLGNGENAFRTIFLIALIPAAIAVFAIIFFVKEPKAKVVESKQPKPKFWESLKLLNQKYKKFLQISCLFSLAYFSFALFIVKANDAGLNPESVLLVYLIYNIFYAASSVPIGSLSDKLGRKPVIAASFVLYGLICLGFLFATQFWQFAVLFAIYGLFVAADESVNKAYISDITDEKTRGMALGAYNSAVGAVYLPANAAFGAIWAMFGVFPAFTAAAAVAILSGAWMAIQK